MTKAGLGVNVDHVATVRQARYRNHVGGLTPEPSVIEAALAAERAGAMGITVHLREDRRHIQDEDVAILKRRLRVGLNLEMAVTDAMVETALKRRPLEVCLVPENRAEVTTEGGLDVAGQLKRCAVVVAKLRKAKMAVSLFIDPIREQVEAAWRSEANFIELHTGSYAEARGAAQRKELRRLAMAAEVARSLGLRVNAGHGLNYENLSPLLKAIPEIHRVNIGHSIVSRAILAGFEAAVREMNRIICEVARR